MFALKDYITSEDIKNLRKNLGLTQKEFASLVGTSKPTIERWEKENAKITGPIVLLSKMINDYPDYVNRLIIPEKEFPVRMFYMYKDDICTLIDVDDAKQLVRIKNYTDKLMFRAFGVNEDPDYNDYKEFLESRCFPRTRDKMKLVLEDIGLPFYDTFMIIEKKDELAGEEKEQVKAGIKEGLEGLAGQIPGLIEVKVRTECLPSSTADVMLDTTFDSVESLKGYAVHPKHVAVADSKVRPYTAVRSCMDYEI